MSNQKLSPARLALILAASLTLGCGGTITPADRAAAYEVFAADHAIKCKVYRFDVASGLSPNVPTMSAACE